MACAVLVLLSGGLGFAAHSPLVIGWALAAGEAAAGRPRWYRRW